MSAIEENVKNGLTSTSSSIQPKLIFVSNFLAMEELKKFEEACLAFFEHKEMAELLQAGLKVNGTITVEIVEFSSYAPACFDNNHKPTIILSAYGKKLFSELSETAKFTAFQSVSFELVNSVNFNPTTGHYKPMTEFETAEEYALYGEKIEFMTYCTVQEKFEKIKQLLPKDFKAYPKLTFEECWKIVNEPQEVYAAGCHADTWRNWFKIQPSVSRKKLENLQEELKENMEKQKKYMNECTENYKKMEVATLQIVEHHAKAYSSNETDKLIKHLELLISLLSNQWMEITQLENTLSFTSATLRLFSGSLKITNNEFSMCVMPKQLRETINNVINTELSSAEKIISSMDKQLNTLNKAILQNNTDTKLAKQQLRSAKNILQIETQQQQTILHYKNAMESLDREHQKKMVALDNFYTTAAASIHVTVEESPCKVM